MSLLRYKRNNFGTFSMLAVLVMLTVVAIMLVACAEKPQLELKAVGPTTQTLEYGNVFTGFEVQASVDGEPVNAEISAEHEPIEKLGTYNVVYTAVYEGMTAQLECTVTVVDTQSPVITLLYIPGHYTQTGTEYVEEGFLATDNYDGDLFDAVIITREADKVIYTVTDSSGNTATAVRNIHFEDHQPPVITLAGEQHINISAGTAFSEPGFTASDLVDGDLTANVEISGQVEIYLPGDYTITYRVTDAGGNEAVAQRKVTVVGRVQQDVVTPDGKVIYLTFDDGPSQYTPKLLEVLARYNVKATFFVVGNARLEYLDDIVDGGHAIGIHSNTHEYSDIYRNEEAFFADFWAIWQKIKDRTGVETTLCRFPGGSSNRVSTYYNEVPGIMTRLTEAVQAQGFQYFDWNVNSTDAESTGAKTADEVYRTVIAGIEGRKTAIVLQHDIKGFSVDAVERIIQWGLANGYTFLPLDPNSPNCHHKVNN